MHSDSKNIPEAEERQRTKIFCFGYSTRSWKDIVVKMW